MNNGTRRREFLAAAAAVPAALSTAWSAAPRVLVEPFDYQGVRLRESRWQQQYQTARHFYLGISDDDILKGFRAAAGLPAPGKTLGGWCEKNSATVLGQWLSGMSRMYRASGDTAMRDKAARLMAGWAKTLKPDGDCGLSHYHFDKMVCGLVDMRKYADHPEAVPLLERITDWASRALSRENLPATPQQDSGRPGEWYTLAENLYRAYRLTGNQKFKTFAEAWLYPAYWGKFADSSAPALTYGLHAYSHVNTFSSAAMAYAVTGDSLYLRIIKNAYDFIQNTQCYATGGFGPMERIMPPDGRLGKSLEINFNSFETPCGSSAGFKLSRYLIEFTGEARYGDWIERLLYNGIGAALPMGPGGETFYYSDCRVSVGMKVYFWQTFTCCSGTYIQDVADYHDLIYFRDGSGLYVNLYVPSEITWKQPEGEIRLIQETQYPEAETTTLTLEMARSVTFTLKFRVPGWATGVTAKVNGSSVNIECKPGSWAAIDRAWASGDQVEVRFPLRFRMEPIDRHHPDRVAVVRGPVVLVLEAGYYEPAFRLPDTDDELNRWLVPTATPGVFRDEQLPERSRTRSRFRPFYTLEERYPYRMYFDRKALPLPLY
jgi:uncharacterized protein